MLRFIYHRKNNYTDEKTVIIVKTFYNGASLWAVGDLFTNKFNIRPKQSASTIEKYIQKFKRHEHLIKRKNTVNIEPNVQNTLSSGNPYIS